MAMMTSPAATARTRVALLAAAVVLLDQASKALAGGDPAGGLLHPVANPEFALGVASASTPVMVALMALGLAAAMAWGLREVSRGRAPAWAVGVLLGGALANLADRALLGAVRDFLVLGGVVVVNLADVAVLAGLAACIAASRRAPCHEVAHSALRASGSSPVPAAQSSS